MSRNTLGWAALFAALLIAACSPPADDGSSSDPPTDTAYVPAPVYCADGSNELCGVMPSMIGPDPALPKKGVGYQGLNDDVESFDEDIQTPFDNMAWQMFVAINQVSGGSYAWESYPRVETLFGADSPACDNPNNLPVFSLNAKSDGTPTGRDEEFLQAATNRPLVDRNGNWVIFERRVNDVEVAYLKNSNWDLTTVAGQQAFIEGGNTVNFTESANVANGSLGAIELKISWRILDTTAGDNPDDYINIQALLSVDASEVRNSDEPICETVTLGLVGFHIVQKNPELRSLLAEWIWASFEHDDNVPLSPNACDPATESICYEKSTPVVCTAPTDDTNTYSFFNGSCTDSGGDCPVNTAPGKLDGEDNYYWSATQPYASEYLYDGKYGTQVARCWQIYKYTQELNTQWKAKLSGASSVLANYTLIGNQWGGNVEPDGSNVANGAVPAFLSNSTMETYIQTEPFGSCIVCHKNAKLAYESDDGGKKVQYDANFSYLLQSAE
ncbi:MAG: hypothetical protein AAGD01_16680 [Acidobacteriota bacterium]